MSTPNYGLPFPVLGDVPNVPADIQALAEATDAALAGAVNAGMDQAAAPASVPGDSETPVSFGVTYAAPPVVVAVLQSSTGYDGYVNVSNVSTTGFTIVYRQKSGAPTARFVHWVAVGTPA